MRRRRRDPSESGSAASDEGVAAPAPADPPLTAPGLSLVADTATVALRTLDDLALVLARVGADDRARQLVLRVADYQRPWRRWVGQPGSMPGLVGVAMSLPEERGPAEVALTAVGARPVHVLLVSAVGALRPQAPPPLALSPRVAADAAALVEEPLLRDRPHPRVAGGRREENWAMAAEVVLHEPTAEAALVDTDRFTPLGRTSPAPGAPVRRKPWSPDLAAASDSGRTAFADLDVIEVPAGRTLGPADVQALLRASACGVVVHVPAAVPLPDLAGPPVPEAVVAAWRAPVPETDSTLLYAASVGQRRAVHRECSALAFRVRALQGEGLLLGADVAVSVLLATRRPANLPTMLAQIAAQEHPAVELILSLHGPDFDDGWVRDQIEAATADRGLPVTVLRLPAEASLGHLLAAATLRASGTFVAKMDDDDGYGPHHLSDLVMAQRWSGAQVTGKPAEFTYLSDRDLTLRVETVTETYGSFVAGGTLLVDRAALMASGGWRPVRSVVDRTMLRRIMDHGALVYRTQGIGYTYVRGSGDHTFVTDEERYLERAVQEWPGRQVPQ